MYEPPRSPGGSPCARTAHRPRVSTARFAVPSPRSGSHRDLCAPMAGLAEAHETPEQCCARQCSLRSPRGRCRRRAAVGEQRREGRRVQDINASFLDCLQVREARVAARPGAALRGGRRIALTARQSHRGLHYLRNVRARADRSAHSRMRAFGDGARSSPSRARPAPRSLTLSARSQQERSASPRCRDPRSARMLGRATRA